MTIHGLQKLTLLDFPGKTACTVFTGGCNLRCPFCHNGDLVLHPTSFPVVPEDEVYALLEKRRHTLEGVCITGGEPMLQKDLPSFCERIKQMGFAVKIDTNGFFPMQLKYIVNSGLADYVAMDVKNTWEKYPETVGIPGLDVFKAKESVSFLKGCGIPHEFRTTVCRPFHEPEDPVAIASMLGPDQPYFLQSFKASEAILGEGVASGFSPSEMKDILVAVRRVHPSAALRGVDV